MPEADLCKILAEYERDFQQIKSTTIGEERTSRLNNLLNKYRNDQNVRSLAHGYAFSAQPEKFDKLSKFWYKVKHEIHENKEQSLKKICEDIVNYPFLGREAEAFRNKHGRLTQEDLDIQFTI